MKKKYIYKIINIATTESTENAYHDAKQNLHSVHTPCSKKKPLKMAARSGLWRKIS